MTASVFFIMGSVIDSLLFGMMAYFTQLLKEEENSINARQDSVYTTLKSFKIPRRFHAKILNYTLETAVTINQHEEYKVFMEKLSPSVRNEVIAQVCKGALRSTLLLQTLEHSDELRNNIQFTPLPP